MDYARINRAVLDHAGIDLQEVDSRLTVFFDGNDAVTKLRMARYYQRPITAAMVRAAEHRVRELSRGLQGESRQDGFELAHALEAWANELGGHP